MVLVAKAGKARVGDAKESKDAEDAKEIAASTKEATATGIIGAFV